MISRILLLFDAHKLDISDEFRRSIEVEFVFTKTEICTMSWAQGLHGHDDKIRIVLNKADMVDHQVGSSHLAFKIAPIPSSGIDAGIWSSDVELGQGISTSLVAIDWREEEKGMFWSRLSEPVLGI